MPQETHHFLRVSLILALGLSIPCVSAAALIEFDGRMYESIDWTSSDPVADVAEGAAGAISVEYSGPEFVSGDIETRDYSTDAAFDEVSFAGSGLMESIHVRGGVDGAVSIRFTRPVSSVLFFVGFPNDATSANQFGNAVWTFDSSLALSIVDTERLPEELSLAGHELTRQGGNDHVSGIVRVNGLFDLLTIDQTSTGLTDRMRFTMAVAPAQGMPEPSTLGLVALGLVGFACNRFRRR